MFLCCILRETQCPLSRRIHLLSLYFDHIITHCTKRLAAAIFIFGDIGLYLFILLIVGILIVCVHGLDDVDLFGRFRVILTPERPYFLVRRHLKNVGALSFDIFNVGEVQCCIKLLAQLRVVSTPCWNCAQLCWSSTSSLHLYRSLLQTNTVVAFLSLSMSLPSTYLLEFTGGSL